jgi:hypothetical protein
VIERLLNQPEERIYKLVRKSANAVPQLNGQKVTPLIE